MLSMIIPCRNEEGNINRILENLSQFENVGEFIFVEGGSLDNTFERLKEEVEKLPRMRIKLIRQSGNGKFNAVLEGIAVSDFQHIAIWDSDLSIDVYDQNLMSNSYFHLDGTPKFVTANRLNPQMHETSMRFLNRLGNHAFAHMVKFSLGLNIPDALAGSKIFPKEILTSRNLCKKAISMDPFGDLFILSRVNAGDLKVVVLNCEYKPRTYGKTNIRRWSGGIKMGGFLLHTWIHQCHKRDS
jgi:glycosyltransferase involved in cell wall biosynthesis